MGTLLKSVLAIAVLTTVTFDGISIATTSVQLQDDAHTAAQVGNDAFRNSGSATAAIRAIEGYVHGTKDQLVSAHSYIDGHHSVEVTLERRAPTILAGMIPQWHSQTHPRVTVTTKDAIS